jgi:hypothetical protein
MRNVNQEMEDALLSLVRALSLRSRKWHYRLTKTLGGPISSPEELRVKIVARLEMLGEPCMRLPGGQHDERFRTK